MPGGVFLSGEQVELHTVTPEDYAFLHEYGNHQTVREGAPVPTPVSMQDIAAFIEEDSESIQFLVCQEETPVGFVFLFNIESQRDHAEIGLWIAPDEHGKGYGTEAIQLGLEYAFADHGLHKVLARVFEHNEASQRILKKLEFEQEGRLREHDYIRGDFRDTLLFGILASEWERKHESS